MTGVSRESVYIRYLFFATYYVIVICPEEVIKFESKKIEIYLGYKIYKSYSIFLRPGETS